MPNVAEAITANSNNAWIPQNRGRYLFVVGSNSADVAFDSGTITISQHGITLKDDANANATATSAKRIVCNDVIDNVAMNFALTGSSGSSNIDIDAYKMPEVTTTYA